MLKDKIALITGGGRGIGRAVAESLARSGCKIVAVSRSLDELNNFKKELTAEGFSIEILAGDVSSEAEVQKIVDYTVKKFGTINILVNAAGIYGPIGPLHENDIEKWAQTIQINLLGTVRCVHAVLPIMQKNKGGKIINFAGGGAVNSFPNFSSYATSKAAIVRFTETISDEYKSDNIQINAIAPGAVNTKLLDESLSAGAKMVGEKFYDKILEQKKNGGDSPQLAADLAVYLASSRSHNLTGKLISAKWDNWQAWDEAYIMRINNSSEYTLRRIDNKYFKEIEK